MKKILFTILTAVSIFTSAFAKDKTSVNYKTAEAFNSKFQEATDVNWTSSATFTKASFTLDGEKMDAFYSYEGEMLGITQTVSLETLSKKVQQNLEKKYSAYTIKEVVAMQSEEEKCHFISAENESENLILKVKNDVVSVFQKTKLK